MAGKNLRLAREWEARNKAKRDEQRRKRRQVKKIVPRPADAGGFVAALIGMDEFAALNALAAKRKVSRSSIVRDYITWGLEMDSEKGWGESH